MGEAAGIILALVLVASARRRAVERGRRSAIVDVQEGEFGRRRVVVEAGEPFVDAVGRLPALVADGADRGVAEAVDRLSRRECHGLELRRRRAVADVASDRRLDRRRCVDNARGAAVGSDPVEEAGTRMADGAVLGHRAFLVPVREGLGAGVGVRRGEPGLHDLVGRGRLRFGGCGERGNGDGGDGGETDHVGAPARRPGRSDATAADRSVH